MAGISDVTASTISFRMDDHRTITANFVPSTTRYAVTTASATGGSISLEPQQSDYLVKQTITVTPVPDEGYAFDHWTGDLSGTTAPIAVKIMGNKSISAVFNPVLTVEKSVADGGDIEANPSLTSTGYPVGTAVSVTVLPSIDYLFDRWTGDVAGISDVFQATVSVTMDAPRTLVANFVPAPRVVIAAGAQTDGSGSVRLDPPQPANGYAIGQELKAYALAGPGCGFSHWAGSASGTNPIATVTVDGQTSIVAVFDPKVNLQFEPLLGGTCEITPPESSGGYVQSSQVTVQAKPASGYRFSEWAGDLSGHDNPTILTVDSPKTVTAVFVKQYSFPWGWAIFGVFGLLVGAVVLRVLYVLVKMRLQPIE